MQNPALDLVQSDDALVRAGLFVEAGRTADESLREPQSWMSHSSRTGPIRTADVLDGDGDRAGSMKTAAAVIAPLQRAAPERSPDPVVPSRAIPHGGFGRACRRPVTGIFDEALPVVDDFTRIELIVQDAIEPLTTPVDGRCVPLAAAWSNNAFTIQATCNVERRVAINIFLKDAPDDVGLWRVDRPLTTILTGGHDIVAVGFCHPECCPAFTRPTWPRRVF